MSLATLLAQARPFVAQRLAAAAPLRCVVFFSLCDGVQRARVCHAVGQDFEAVWNAGVNLCEALMQQHALQPRWLRVDWLTDTYTTTWGALQARWALTKRNYFRFGLALDNDFAQAFLEQELNANAMLYLGADTAHAGINHNNFKVYARRRFGAQATLDFAPERSVCVFAHDGVFVALDDAQLNRLPGGHAPQYVPGPPHTQLRWREPEVLNAGRRQLDALDADAVYALIDGSANFLAGDVEESGRFIYGHFPCFGRQIGAYNTLRHASSVYAMLEAWELTRNAELLAAIQRSLAYLTDTLIRRYPQQDGPDLAFTLEVNGEIKLGANAVSLLALVKYDELLGDTRHRPLMEALALGIAHMQNPSSGAFVHVLNASDLSVKDAYRIIYYDGEAAFGLMRLYGLTRDPRWLTVVERAFEHFLAAEHWRHHDHWLSYCANELTLHKPEEKYFRFGVNNIADYIDFIQTRETTFPTLLELSMAFHTMLGRIQARADVQPVLAGLDIEAFYRALHHRAQYLLNGFFWPELAMYYAKPLSILGSFFIRHHSFRVRIDDVEHYLSGYVAYWKMLHAQAPPPIGVSDQSETNSTQTLAPTPAPAGVVVAWGGDVNLGRRQHYRTAELGADAVLRIPALREADLRIINLECVVATQGEQGVIKGEGGPYYYRARPEMLEVLSAAHIDIVATANNHSGDYGPAGVIEQASWLDVVGIGYCGSGADREAAFTPVLRRAGALNVAMFAIDATQHRFAATAEHAGSAYLALDDAAAWQAEMAPRIAAARQHAQVVLVAVHWGANGARTPTDAKVAVGHALIDAGADAVLGASAHVLQGIEIYRQRPIVHDAGDLLFDAVRDDWADGGVFRLELDHTGVRRVVFVPVGVGFGVSEQLQAAPAIAAARRFALQCAELGSELTLCADGSAYIDLSPPPRPIAVLPPAPLSRLTPEAVDNVIAHLPLPAGVTVTELPPDALRVDQRFGPLRLIAVRIRPTEAFTRRRMLWVESFWCCDAEVVEDIRLNFRAVPTRPGRMRPWGVGMDHDPCDWRLPTSRWRPGVMYRDLYGLRPPYLKGWENGELQLHAGIVSCQFPADLVTLPLFVRLAIPGKDVPAPAMDTPAPTTLPTPHYRDTFPELIHATPTGFTWTAEQLETLTGGRWLVPPPAGWGVRSVGVVSSSLAQLPPPVMYFAHTRLDRARHEQPKNLAKVLADNWDSHTRLPALHRSLGDSLAAVAVTRADACADLPSDLPVLLLDDPIQAVIELGLAARQRFTGEVIAVTGTAGKSSTLGLLQTLLGGPQRVLASLDNYNSRVGAPATLASLGPDYEAAVVEVAQSALWMQRGPITRRLRPTVAVLTEIGLSQTDSRIRSLEDVAKWKSRVFDGLCGAAIAVIGEHLPCFEAVRQTARQHAQRLVVFGPSAAAEIRILSVEADADGSWVDLQLPSDTLRVRVPMPGVGMVHNAVAALSVAYALGHDMAEAVARLAQAHNPAARLQRQTLDFGAARVTLIDDSFNAEVISTVNALSVLQATPVAPGARKVAVLARIVHLGEQAQSLHESLAAPVLASGAEVVLTHGDEMRFLRARLPESLLGPHFSDAPSLVAHLCDTLRDGDCVLLKGSRRDSDFGHVASLLAEASTADASA